MRTSIHFHRFADMEDKKLKKAVVDSGYMRMFLAKKIGTKQSQLSEWMTGKRGLPKPAKEKLIEFLNFKEESE